MPPVFALDFVIDPRRGNDFRPLLAAYRGDVGLLLRVRVQDEDGVPVDLTGVGDITIVFTKPDGTTFTRDMELLGEPGMVAYSFAAGELMAVGLWDFHLEGSAFSGRSEVESFRVWPTLPI